MKLKAKFLELETGGKPIVIVNKEDAEELGIRGLSRIVIKAKEKKLTGIVNTTTKIVEKGELGISENVGKILSLKDKEEVEIEVAKFPSSLQHIKNKLKGKKLSYEEIFEIVKDVVEGNLSEGEISSFVTALETKGIDLDEAASLSLAMVETGKKLELKKKVVVDKHSIGGISGDKTTLLVVPIVAAAGLTIPKTSSRAITGASAEYDTPIIIKKNEDVEITKIGEFVDKMVDEFGKESEETCSIELPETEYSVPAFNRDLKISFKKLTGVSRHKSPKELLELTLENNRKVIVTKDHSLFVLKNGFIKSLPTSEIGIGDFVAVPRKIKINASKKELNLVEEFLRKLPESYLQNIFVKGIDKKQFKGELIGSPRDRMRYYRGTIPLNLLRNKKVRISDKTFIKFKGSKRQIPAKIMVTKELMRLLGYFIAEGVIGNYNICFYLGSHEENIIQDIKLCTKKIFGLDAEVRNRKDCKTETDVVIEGKTISLLFRYVFETGMGAANKKIPKIVFQTNDNLKKEFLEALIKGDGNKRSKDFRFEITTVSKKLFIDLQYLLNFLGIGYSSSEVKEHERDFGKYVSKCKKAYKIYTSYKGQTNFVNMLPIRESGLINYAIAKEIINNESNKWKLGYALLHQQRISFDTLHNGLIHIEESDSGELEMPNLWKLIKGDITFLRVKSIEKKTARNSFVYDLCVEGYENFIGGEGAIFLHNSGSADRAEVLMPVALSTEEMKRIVEKTNGCIAWGGALHLAPADDIFIQAEYPLTIDPLLLPSIMAKKKAVGSNFLVVDIPTGRGAKMKTIGEANLLAKDFIELGRRLGIKTECAITDGEQPVGFAVGPALEAREALEVLMRRKKVEDLIDKAAHLAGIIFEMSGKKNGYELALEILNSGKAEKKMREIIRMQGGKEKIKPEDIVVGDHKLEIVAEKGGIVLWLNNAGINDVARAAGAPKDKGAGILLNKKLNEKVSKGEKILTIYAEKERKLERANELLKENKVIGIGERREMLIQRVKEVPLHKKTFILER